MADTPKSDATPTKRRTTTKPSSAVATKTSKTSSVKKAAAPTKAAAKPVAKRAVKTVATPTGAAKTTKAAAPKTTAVKAVAPKATARKAVAPKAPAAKRPASKAAVAPDNVLAETASPPASRSISKRTVTSTVQPATGQTLTVADIATALMEQAPRRRSPWTFCKQTLVPTVFALGLGFGAGAASGVEVALPDLNDSVSVPATFVMPATSLPPLQAGLASNNTPAEVTAAPASVPAPIPAPVPSTQLIALSGNDSRQSAAFVSDGSPVTVTVESDGVVKVRLLQVNVAGEGDLVADCTTACTLTTPLAKAAGDYFLDINSTGSNWKITVTQ